MNNTYLPDLMRQKHVAVFDEPMTHGSLQPSLTSLSPWQPPRNIKFPLVAIRCQKLRLPTFFVLFFSGPGVDSVLKSSKWTQIPAIFLFLSCPVFFWFGILDDCGISSAKNVFSKRAIWWACVSG